jgi:hypothetical protein
LSSVGSDADASSLARLEEERNLLYTMSVSGNPLLGTGWGLPYQKVTSFYANYRAEWVLALYTPHNSLLGITVFAGLVGILGIWWVVPVTAFLAARGYNRSTHPTNRTAAMVAIAMLTAYSVHCYGDIGFQSLTCGLILGVALATAGKVAAWSRTPASRKPVQSPAGDARTTRGTLPAAPNALASRMQDVHGLRRAMPTAANGAAARTGRAPTQRAGP